MTLQLFADASNAETVVTIVYTPLATMDEPLPMIQLSSRHEDNYENTKMTISSFSKIGFRIPYPSENVPFISVTFYRHTHIQDQSKHII